MVVTLDAVFSYASGHTYVIEKLSNSLLMREKRTYRHEYLNLPLPTPAITTSRASFLITISPQPSIHIPFPPNQSRAEQSRVPNTHKTKTSKGGIASEPAVCIPIKPTTTKATAKAKQQYHP
jgi:hypothetical protein